MSTTPAPPTLELRGVTKSFGQVHALRGVDFEVRVGEVMALVGDNGAGKSTLIKCVAGIYSIDSGQVLYDGEPVSIAAVTQTGVVAELTEHLAKQVLS